MKCPRCGTFVKCVECADFICPSCGSELPQPQTEKVGVFKTK